LGFVSPEVHLGADGKVGHLIVVHSSRGVRSEEVTREEELVFDKVGEHRLRPVHERGLEELQRPSSQVQLLPVFYDLHPLLGGLIQALGQPHALFSEDEPCFRAFPKQHRDRSSVVGLGVVHDHVVERRWIRDRPDLGEELALEPGIDRIDEGNPFFPLHQIRVI
jgi:hypothetical protein